MVCVFLMLQFSFEFLFFELCIDCIHLIHFRHKRLMHLLTKSQFFSQYLLEKIQSSKNDAGNDNNVSSKRYVLFFLILLDLKSLLHA